jgi:hypothetical protein
VRARRASGALALCVTTLVACQPEPQPVSCDRAPLDVSAEPSTALEQRFHAYGDDGTSLADWTGGDGAYSAPLPDGRRAWFFQDTFLGAVTPGHGRPLDTPLVPNHLVVQGPDGALIRRTASPPAPHIAAPSGWYWPADAVVEGTRLRVLVNEPGAGDDPCDGSPASARSTSTTGVSS